MNIPRSLSVSIASEANRVSYNDHLELLGIVDEFCLDVLEDYQDQIFALTEENPESHGFMTYFTGVPIERWDGTFQDYVDYLRTQEPDEHARVSDEIKTTYNQHSKFIGMVEHAGKDYSIPAYGFFDKLSSAQEMKKKMDFMDIETGFVIDRQPDFYVLSCIFKSGNGYSLRHNVTSNPENGFDPGSP